MDTTDQNQLTELDRENGRRSQLVIGLRQLADFIVAHPEFPIPRRASFDHCVSGRNDEAGIAEVNAIADALGAPVDGLDDGDTHIGTHHRFSGLGYHAFYVRRGHMAEYDADMSFLHSWQDAGRPPLDAATPEQSEPAADEGAEPQGNLCPACAGDESNCQCPFLPVDPSRPDEDIRYALADDLVRMGLMPEAGAR